MGEIGGGWGWGGGRGGGGEEDGGRLSGWWVIGVAMWFVGVCFLGGCRSISFWVVLGGVGCMALRGGVGWAAAGTEIGGSAQWALDEMMWWGGGGVVVVWRVLCLGGQRPPLL